MMPGAHEEYEGPRGLWDPGPWAWAQQALALQSLLLPPLAPLEAQGQPAGLPAQPPGHPAHLAPLAHLASSHGKEQTPEGGVLDLACLRWESTPAGAAELATLHSP